MVLLDRSDVVRTTLTGATKMTSIASDLMTKDEHSGIYSLALLASNLRQSAPLDGVPAFTIGQVSDQLQLTPRAIRFYEKCGLVNPGRSGRFRLYVSKDLAMLEFIKCMRSLGMGVQELTNLVTNMRRSSDENELLNILKLTMEKHLSSLEESIRNSQEQYDRCFGLLSDKG